METDDIIKLLHSTVQLLQEKVASLEEVIVAQHEKIISLEQEIVVLKSTPSDIPEPVALPSSCFHPSYQLLSPPRCTPKYVWSKDFSKFPQGIDVHEKDKYGNNILAYCNNEELFHYALTRGVDIHNRNELGLTPLHFAYRNKQCIRLLLEAGAKPNAYSKRGHTPLFLVKTIEIAEILMSYGASCMVLDSTGNSLLHKTFGTPLYDFYLARGVIPTRNHSGLLPGEKRHVKKS